jgi:RsmE family RNA methyltransferase
MSKCMPWFLVTCGASPMLEALPETFSRMPNEAVAALIGPEGGWIAFEHEQTLNEGAPVSLGPQVLRTETAAVSVASIVFNAWWAGSWKWRPEP